jgi:hypothetical protein
MNEVRARLAEVPAEVVITNHVMGLYELAAIHLSATPPDLRQAVLAIDAVACLVDGLGDRLGDDAATMQDALANIRLAFVQIKGQVGAPATSEASAEPSDRGVDHTIVVHRHPLGSQQLGLQLRLTRPETTRGVDHPPPGHVVVGRREDPSRRVGPASGVRRRRRRRRRSSPRPHPTPSGRRRCRVHDGFDRSRMLAASHRPNLASRPKSTSAPTSIVRDRRRSRCSGTGARHRRLP